MSGDIIDLHGRRGREESHFSVYGGEGVKARFALPAWRAASLVGAKRAGILRRPAPPPLQSAGPVLVRDPASRVADAERVVERTESVFVLDLGAAEVRPDFEGGHIAIGMQPPQVRELGETVVVALGEVAEWDWFLVLDAAGEPLDGLTAEDRERLVFFAGECAGLLHTPGIGPPEE